MKIKHTRRLGIVIVATSFVTAAYAIGAGFYMGAQVGSTNLHNTTRAVQTGLSSPATVFTDPSNTGVGQRFFIGAGINQYAAVELGYTHYGASTYKPTPSALANDPTIRENGVDFTGKAMYPFQNMSVFGKLGVTRVTQSLSGSLQPLPPAQSTGATQYIRPLVGVGASYELTPSWITDLSWTRALKGGNGFKDADFIALGLSYHFVDKFCGQFLC